MKKLKAGHKKVRPYDPNKAFSKMFELATQIEQLDPSNIEDAEEQKGKLNKKIYKLSKAIKDYYKGLGQKAKKGRK